MSGKMAGGRIRLIFLRRALQYNVLYAQCSSASGNVAVTRNSALEFIYCAPINVPSGIKPPINSTCFNEWWSNVAFDRVADVCVVTCSAPVFVKFPAYRQLLNPTFYFAVLNADLSLRIQKIKKNNLKSDCNKREKYCRKEIKNFRGKIFGIKFNNCNIR